MRVAGAQEPAHDPTGGRAVVDTAGTLPSETLHGATKTLGLKEMQNELGVLRSDRPVAVGVDDVAPAEDLDLHPITRAPAFDQLVDELLHCEVPVAGRLRIVPPATRVPERQHKVIHPADPAERIANACRNAGAEDRDKHLIRPRGHVEFAREYLDHPRLARVVEESPTLGGIDALLAVRGLASLWRGDHPSLR